MRQDIEKKEKTDYVALQYMGSVGKTTWKVKRSRSASEQGYFILTSQRINSLSYTLSPFKRT